MRTLEELQEAVRYSLNDDNQRTDLTEGLMRVINLRKDSSSAIDCEAALCKMYDETNSRKHTYTVMKDAVKEQYFKNEIREAECDYRSREINKELAVLRLRTKVLGFSLRIIDLEGLVGKKRFNELQNKISWN